MKFHLPIFFPLFLFTAALALKSDSASLAKVTDIPDEVREEFDLKPHYQKLLLLEGFPIVSSEKVPDAALLEAASIIGSMLKNRPDILVALAKHKIRYAIMATTERTCDIPEHADLKPKEFWNRRARGLGATPQRPSVSCGVENLLRIPGDPYDTESICVHEFAHAIHGMALNILDPTFDSRLEKTYQIAMTKGLWSGKYAATNRQEYWAEAVQSWFGTNRESDHDHNHVNSRAELIEYDPAVAKLCAEVFGDNDWKYLHTDDPSRQNEPHLKALDRSKRAPFGWTDKEQEDYDDLSKDK